MKQAFRSRNAPTARQTEIMNDYGIRWSALNLVSGWKPSRKTALDFMHNVFLGKSCIISRSRLIAYGLLVGIICHLFMKVLFASHMFSGIGGANSAKQRFEDLVNAVKWPSHVTRLPKNVDEFLPCP